MTSFLSFTPVFCDLVDWGWACCPLLRLLSHFKLPTLKPGSPWCYHSALLLAAHKGKGGKKQEQRSAIWGQTCTLCSESAPLPGLCY